jgi:hypothetical protein
MIAISIQFRDIREKIVINTDLSDQQFWAQYGQALSHDRKVVIPAKQGLICMVNPADIVYLTVEDLEKPVPVRDDSYEVAEVKELSADDFV